MPASLIIRGTFVIDHKFLEETIMMNSGEQKKLMKIYAGVGLSLVVLLIPTAIAFSHGGKHAADDFTHLQALKKAIELYGG